MDDDHLDPDPINYARPRPRKDRVTPALCLAATVAVAFSFVHFLGGIGLMIVVEDDRLEDFFGRALVFPVGTMLSALFPRMGAEVLLLNSVFWGTLGGVVVGIWRWSRARRN